MWSGPSGTRSSSTSSARPRTTPSTLGATGGRISRTTRTWREAVAVYADRRVVAVAFLGFSSGLPLLLVFSTLSLWLKDEGISNTAIGLFALVRTPYTFKFLWAPLIDQLRVPAVTRRLGRRRSWALVTQGALLLAILALATTDPSEAPWMTAAFAVLVAFASASQDVVIDALRVESLDDDQQGAGAGAIVLGYRLGMLLSGAGAVWLASMIEWPQVYAIVGGFVFVGVATVLAVSEPESAEIPPWPGLTAWARRAIVAPLLDFTTRPSWVLVLVFIMLYKLGDAYLGVMANPFYVEMGFSKEEIAAVSKVFGLGATLVGGLLGGVVVARFGVVPSLLGCGVLQALSNLVFALQAVVGYDVRMLVVTIAIENVTGAMATAAFVAFLSGLCNVAYTATQYALLSSLMAFARDVLSASSGLLADSVSWVAFFTITTVAALPALFLIAWLRRALESPPDASG